MTTFCKHCGGVILQHNFSSGPGWTHDDGSFNGRTYCHRTTASPPDDDEPECEHDWPMEIRSGDACLLGCGATRG